MPPQLTKESNGVAISMPCASPRCPHRAKTWVSDNRFGPVNENGERGAWFCPACVLIELPDSAFVVSATVAWDAWAEIEAVRDATGGQS
jgi:hypothetical protein